MKIKKPFLMVLEIWTSNEFFEWVSLILSIFSMLVYTHSRDFKEILKHFIYNKIWIIYVTLSYQ